jgi:rhamnose utilization protein RhaD (predicted bifunctional aldolase and dehydrogenase)
MNQKHELAPLLALSARIGSDPLFTQGSTGNSSIKLRGCLWIKASGKWMADAMDEDILVPLDLSEVQRCVQQNIDPTERYSSASIETAMHAVFPHRVVLHVHCVNTIAWAVRQDAPSQLEHQLRGLRWKWIPYVSSGLALANAIQKALPVFARPDVLILGNHGLVVGGEDCETVEQLLSEVQRRLSIRPRQAHPPDYAALADLADRLSWEVPADDDVHALGTDAISQTVLSGGFLYPCQAIFSNSGTPVLFRSVPYADRGDRVENGYCRRPFIVLEGRGVILNRTTSPAERAMISGLAQVVQRISASTPIRYLTEAEAPNLSGVVAGRYRELSNASHGGSPRQVRSHRANGPS